MKSNSILAGMLGVAMFISPLSPLAQNTPTPTKKSQGRSKKVPVQTIEERLDNLTKAVDAQNQQIQTLQQQLRQREQDLQAAQAAAQSAQAAAQEAQARAASAQAAAENASAQQQTVGKIQSELADVRTSLTSAAASAQDDQKKVSELSSTLGRFRFSGDIRVRNDDAIQKAPLPGASDCPASSCDPRVRERIRLRFGVEGKLNEEFNGGIFVATGTLADPTSTNETLTNAFEKKTIGFDRGWISYNPRRAKFLTLTGGKFAANWQKTNQTLDPDLNPEGFSARFSYDLRNAGPVKNVNFNVVQLFFNESSRGADSYASGAQVAGRLVLGRVTLTPSYMYLKWHKTDVLLNEPAAVTGASGITCSTATPPVCSIPNGAFAPNGMTNSTTADKLHFTGGFAYSDFIVDSTIKTGLAKYPVRVIVEYLQNLDAGVGTISNPTGNATGRTKQDKLYQGEIDFGQLKDKGDLLFGYAWTRAEQDAVIAAWAESDQRAPTNILQNRIFGSYNVQKNVSLVGTVWIGRTLNPFLQNAAKPYSAFPAGVIEPYYKRLQFDAIYKF